MTSQFKRHYAEVKADYIDNPYHLGGYECRNCGELFKTEGDNIEMLIHLGICKKNKSEKRMKQKKYLKGVKG